MAEQASTGHVIVQRVLLAPRQAALLFLVIDNPGLTIAQLGAVVAKDKTPARTPSPNPANLNNILQALYRHNLVYCSYSLQNRNVWFASPETAAEMCAMRKREEKSE